MARVEVPCDMKGNRKTGVRGHSPLGMFSTTPFKNWGNALLDIKIRPFPDRKEQLNLLFQCYLQVY